MAKKQDNLKAHVILKNTQKLVTDGAATVDLPRRMNDALENELFKEWTDSQGRPFETFQDAVSAQQPYGYGIGQYSGWVNAQQAYALSEGYGELRKNLLPLVVAEVEPAAKHGRPKAGEGKGSRTTFNDRGAAYQIATLKRDMEHGKTKKLREQCRKAYEILIDPANRKAVKTVLRECGLIKPSRAKSNPEYVMQRAKEHFLNLTADQKAEFRKWLDQRS